ncbi:invasion associated locus B family protein, partial [Ruegeria sp. NA]
MFKKILSFNTVAAVLLSGAAYAQDTTTTAPDAGLDLGQEGPRVGEQFVKEEFGDWDVSCIKAQEGEDPCAIVQVLEGKNGDPIAEVSIGKLPEGGAAVAWANVIVPLETLLHAQLALSI